MWRSATNVGKVDSTYKAIIEWPPRINMDVEPLELVFNTTITKHSFKITFSKYQRVQSDFYQKKKKKNTQRVQSGCAFGSFTWIDG